uniref:Uncharacterized protein n=1 Tax=Oryza meridionalis TaxID=40149 RepID=A0A0E0BWC1_9ORYZ
MAGEARGGSDDSTRWQSLHASAHSFTSSMQRQVGGFILLQKALSQQSPHGRGVQKGPGSAPQ